MNKGIELNRLTIYNIIDNSTDSLSSPCPCLTPTPNINSSTFSIVPPDLRPCTYTQEVAQNLIQHNKTDNDGEMEEQLQQQQQQPKKKKKEWNMEQMCFAAHGSSILLIGEHDSGIEYLLWDGGPDPKLWCDNVQKLGLEDIITKIDTVVLSHYHTDHSNGLRGAIPYICREKYPIHFHDHRNKGDTFPSTSNGDDSILHIDLHDPVIKTRGVKVRGKIYAMTPSNPTIEELESSSQMYPSHLFSSSMDAKYGSYETSDNCPSLSQKCQRRKAKVQLHKDGHWVSNDSFYVSGKIPRKTEFEKGLSGHFTQHTDEKNWIPDEQILDERYLACRMRGRGILVFSSCSHAGIINVCLDAMNQIGPENASVNNNSESTIMGVVGGLHLSGSSVESRIDETVQALKEINPNMIILAGHCTGWRGQARLASDFPYSFQPFVVGGKYVFSSMSYNREKVK